MYHTVVMIELVPLSISLSIRPYGPSLLGGPLKDIRCSHRNDVSVCWSIITGISMCKNP